MPGFQYGFVGGDGVVVARVADGELDHRVVVFVHEVVGVHPSNATRTGDRLEAAGLVCREGDPVDRRSLRLRLTGKGRSLVERVMSHRRHALNDVVERMKPDDRRMLETALSAFAEAAGEMPDEAMSAALGLG